MTSPIRDRTMPATVAGEPVEPCGPGFTVKHHPRGYTALWIRPMREADGTLSPLWWEAESYDWGGMSRRRVQHHATPGAALLGILARVEYGPAVIAQVAADLAAAMPTAEEREAEHRRRFRELTSVTSREETTQ